MDNQIRFFWVDIHYACFGLEATNSVITNTAPIVKWMMGKTLQQIKPWLLQKKAIVKEIQLNQ